KYNLTALHIGLINPCLHNDLFNQCGVTVNNSTGKGLSFLAGKREIQIKGNLCRKIAIPDFCADNQILLFICTK
ncbi:hypothetical protein, partial [Erwinia billingiae]|uniref:hypothetical protein n=1 Tax=Erwinia billingiae TaxID=182337 RepID=UPI001A7E4050